MSFSEEFLKGTYACPDCGDEVEFDEGRCQECQEAREAQPVGTLGDAERLLRLALDFAAYGALKREALGLADLYANQAATILSELFEAELRKGD